MRTPFCQSDLIILRWAIVGIPWQLTNQSLRQCQDCLRGNGISFGNVTASSEACDCAARCFFTPRMRVRGSVCVCVCVEQGRRTAAYALCIINEHTERNHNARSALHNASVSQAGGVGGHVWLCAWPLRTKTKQGDL